MNKQYKILKLTSYDLSKPGLWECWKLEDDSIILIDIIEEQKYDKRFCDHDFHPTHYRGIKIKEKLGAALDLWTATCMYQQFKQGFIDIDDIQGPNENGIITIGYWEYK